tara:strand:+ start:2630 stop:2917 length:288 start_codon:yes stop_codon:yes gene_type:complete
MRLTRRQLQNMLLEEVSALISEADGPPYDMYREEEMRRVFGELDGDWWNGPPDRPGVLSDVSEDALKSLGEFLKKDPAWRAWYEGLADDGTGGTA